MVWDHKVEQRRRFQWLVGARSRCRTATVPVMVMPPWLWRERRASAAARIVFMRLCVAPPPVTADCPRVLAVE